jgi:signal transduction histidine kinase
VKFIGGFGIGLSLVAKIIELHKAELNINSKEKEGTRIEIRFKRFNE